jgi:hypothetical protein
VVAPLGRAEDGGAVGEPDGDDVGAAVHQGHLGTKLGVSVVARYAIDRRTVPRVLIRSRFGFASVSAAGITTDDLSVNPARDGERRSRRPPEVASSSPPGVPSGAPRRIAFLTSPSRRAPPFITPGAASEEDTMTELMVQKGMTDGQKVAFQQAYERERKDATVAILLALFLGGLGAHHFYLGNVGIGILYAVFVWTFIPSLIALIELFTLKGRVDRRNEDAAQRIAQTVKAYAD